MEGALGSSLSALCWLGRAWRGGRRAGQYTCSLRLLRRPGPQVPPNGLVVYTGTVLTEDGKEKKLNIDFEPFKPINTRWVP